MVIDDGLFKKPEGISTRWASPENPSGEKGKSAQTDKGRKGSPCFSLEPGECRVLAEEKKISGTIRRIWATISQRDISMLRGLKIEFFWDGADKPAISAPFGDFFGHGLGRMAAFESAAFTSPEGKSFNCYIPMPFRKGMKITVTNETTITLGAFFYDVNYTIGDSHGEDVLYLHAHYHRENPTMLLQDYEILPRVSGKGRFLGCNIGVNADRKRYSTSWWGEGEVKIFIDGDRELPTLCGTGTEDYIGTGWGQGQYDHLYQGCTVADMEHMQYCFYRYHIVDPVYFDQDIRITIQQIGCWDPVSKTWLHYNGEPIKKTTGEIVDFSKDGGTTDYGIYERQDDWSSCAYFYLDNPVNALPDLELLNVRTKQI